MLRTTTYRVAHPQYANMLVEMDVEEEEEEEENIQPSSSPEARRMGATAAFDFPSHTPPPAAVEYEMGEDFEHIGVKPPPIQPAHQVIIGRFPRLYIFAGMLANALGVDDLRQLLRHPKHGWGMQALLPNFASVFDNSIPEDDKSTTAAQYDFMLRSVFSAYTYGGMNRAYQRLHAEMPPDVTLKDLIVSDVTSDTFAAYCALLSKSSTGAFAQQGRLYSGGGGHSRSMYYVTSGNERHRQLDRQLASHIFWFKGVRKGVEGDLYYRMPDQHTFLSKLM